MNVRVCVCVSVEYVRVREYVSMHAREFDMYECIDAHEPLCSMGWLRLVGSY